MSMKLSSEWSQVEVFTSSGEWIYGYDSVNPSLLLSSSDESRSSRLHFSSNPSWPIRRLILNSNETLVALLADRLSYLVQLPSPSSQSSLCPILRVSPPSKSSGSLIEFLWLSVDEFVLVYSSSSSTCHLYSLRSFRSESLDRCETFAIGPASTSSKKLISLHQPSDILQLALIRSEPRQILALKSDGEIYFFDRVQCPVRMLPSAFNNYGSDHQQSLLVSLFDSSIVLLTRDRRQLDQCLLLRTVDEVFLYRVDSIILPEDQHIVSIVPHRSSSERYFLLDSRGNVYSVRISWIDQIEDGEKHLRPTLIEHLVHNSLPTNKIEHIASMDNSLLLVILHENKEILCLDSGRSIDSSSFVRRLRSLLVRTRSIPQLTFTSSSSMSNEDLEKNLSTFLQIFSEEYLHRQERVQREIEEKQIVLTKLHQTQLNECQRLQQRFIQINTKSRLLFRRYEEELSRRQRLSSCVDDLLSVIEQNLPVLSENEVRMREQLERYQIQVDYFQENLARLRAFLSSPTANQEENLAEFIRNYRRQIEQIQEHLVKMKRQTMEWK